MSFQYQFFNKETDLIDQVFDVAAAQRVKQVHGNTVISIAKPQDEWIEADGIITQTPELPIGVITADCAPVLLAADGVVGAAHAGWQGALNGVLDNTVKAMGVRPDQIHAYIGPCISQKSYEVSIGFEEPFLKRDAEAERFFMAGAEEKLHFDLPGYCAYRLSQTGVQKIHIDGTDTLSHGTYHSHRGGAGATERNLSAIMLSR